MKISVAYHGQLRAAAGVAAEEVVVAAEVSMRDLAEALALRHPPLRGLLFSADGAVSRSVLIAVGERQVRAGEALGLREGDVVTLLPPIGGG